MKPSHALLLLPTLLVACGGDDAADLTGVFVDGPVSGLHYATKGANGQTNAAGEFKYSAGQSVTFSVGGIVIGKAVGAERVTPFDLYGVTPPTTTQGLTDQLAAPDEVTDLERVLNVAVFLAALDTDRDLTNGIDLAAADAALAGASLDFDEAPRVFAVERLRPLLAERGVGNVYVGGAEAGAHLFTSVGIVIPAYAIASTSRDLGSNGTVDSSQTAEYNALGQRTRRNDINAAGIVTQRAATEYTTDHQVASITLDYNSAGGGLFHARELTTYTYDTVDRHLVSSAHDTYAEGVLASHEVATNTVNAAGSVTENRVEIDLDASGAFDVAHVITTEYDANNRPKKITTVIYDDLGVTANQSELQTYTYDDAGNRLEYVYERDTGVDGNLEQRQVTTTTYDDAHRIVTNRFDNENTAHVLLDRIFTTNTYDSGLAVQTVIETDVDGDGSYEYVETITRTFTPERKVQLELSDGVNGGLIHNLERTEYDYDATTGRLTQIKTTTNQNSQANPADDRIELDTFTYDDQGNQLVTENQVDSNADLTFDVKEKNAATYTAIADGVRFLLSRVY